MVEQLMSGVYPDYQIDGEPFALLVISEHNNALAMTAIHTTEFSRTIGGVRFVKAGNLNELGHLSRAMTEKCMAANIPAGGQKTVIIADPTIIASDALKADVLRQHMARVIAQCRSEHFTIFGPDMNATETVMDLVAADPHLRSYVTGLSETEDGLSIDRNGYTALGLAEAVKVWTDNRKNHALQTVIVQGFGAVGAHTARILSRNGLRICGISNIHGAVVSRENSVVDAEAFFQAWRKDGDPGMLHCSANRKEETVFSSDGNELFRRPADIFVPAARTSCFGVADELTKLREENPDACDVSILLNRARVRLIVEGANHPLSTQAEIFLEDNGVAILTDFIVNCGGLIGCWYEWLCRYDKRPTGDSVGLEAKRHIKQTIHANVTELLSAKSARGAAGAIVDRNRAAYRQLGR